MTATEQVTYRDVVITDLADSLDAAEVRVRALETQVVELETDVAAYRELTCAALDALQMLTLRGDALARVCEALGDRHARRADERWWVQADAVAAEQPA